MPERAAREIRETSAPEGYHSLSPYLRVSHVEHALRFYERAFGAVEDFRRESEGTLLIVVIVIGDSRLMISAHENEPGRIAGGDPRGNGLVLKLYVDDVDAVFDRAIASGARVEEAIEDHFFGERSGAIVDPFGFTWRVAQFVEDVPHAEIERRMRHEARPAARS
jgi:PhnB protein